jgi:glutamine synthetase type III
MPFEHRTIASHKSVASKNIVLNSPPTQKPQTVRWKLVAQDVRLVIPDSVITDIVHAHGILVYQTGIEEAEGHHRSGKRGPIIVWVESAA